MTENDELIKLAQEEFSLAEFLESTPPSSPTEIRDLSKKSVYQGGSHRGYFLSKPEIQLHCTNDKCNGTRFFRCTTQNEIEVGEEFSFIYISYICSNCRKNDKTFSLAVKHRKNSEAGECYKFGELPLYGPPTPSKLIKLIGPDRDIFLKGRRCENQGLGIGAFVYYRRVIENQKNRILDDIIKLSEKLSAPEEKINVLKQAKKETQSLPAMESEREGW